MDTHPVIVFPVGIRIAVAPDETVVNWPSHVPIPSRVGMFDWEELPNGTYRPVIRCRSRLVRLRETTPTELGLGVSYRSLRRLMASGFVRGEQLTPGAFAVDLQSYWKHVEAVRADPDFWNEKRKRQYLEAIE